MHGPGRRLATACAATAVTLTAWSEAGATDLWGGLYAHDIEDGLSEGGVEEGPQLAAGVIGRRLQSLERLGAPSPYALAALNTQGGTSYAAAGLSWRVGLGERLYLRPALGAAVHDGETDLPSPYAPGLADVTRSQRFQRGQDELDLGSRVLVHLELALGWRANDQWAVEASWMHLSHGDLAGDQNPGLSDLGVRLVYSFGER
jgi:hypothetical protein